MKWVKNRLIFLLVLAVLCSIIIYFCNILLEKSLNEIIRQTTVRMENRGIYLDITEFESAYFTTPHSFAVMNLRSATLPARSDKLSAVNWLAGIERLDLNFCKAGIEVEIKDFNFEVEEKGEFSGTYARALLPFDWSQPSSYFGSGGKILTEIQSMMAHGRSAITLEVEGKLKFLLGKEMKTVFITTEKVDDKISLLMNKEDVLKISHELGDKLTRAEVDFVAYHPIQAPPLFRIKTYAKNKARSAKETNPSLFEGSYRHVLWSYILTREFGESFAKEVTDCHEIGDREGESRATHDIDYHNNAIGRNYALQKISESEVLRKVLTDPNVIHKD